ncbi:MAG: hypothetical protein R2751_11910 [Bacteroidales bacterium]
MRQPAIFLLPSRKRMNLLPSFLLLCFLAGAAHLAAQSREDKVPVQADDILNLKTRFGPQLSPDGTEVLYAGHFGANEPAGPARVVWFRMDLDQAEARPLFPERLEGTSPRFSPDGRHIGFLFRATNGTRQVGLQPRKGGEVIQLTRAAAGVSDFAFQPGHRGIAYLSGEAETPREAELKAGAMISSSTRKT